MQKLSQIVAAAAVLACMPAGVLLAQDTPGTGQTTPATPVLTPPPPPAAAAPASPPPVTAPATAVTAPPPPVTAPAPVVTAPPPTAAIPAPAAAAPASAAPAAAPPNSTAIEHTTKKKKSAKITRQQEIERSIDSGTVPARYRRSVPKEYQQYIPFAK
jgi:hypothetical protein